jgi:catechol 2,3-dioxygenase-like lactoylglutathione lyase family enzyme
LITTNDNLPALGFYQRRGLAIAAVYPNALEASRRLKPSISLVGLGGIPLRDEIELERRLGPAEARAAGERPPGAILGLHHAQITIPAGEEAAARRFYCGLLGLPEVAKPASLQVRGGFWLQVGDRQVHVGVEEGVDRPATKAHLAYLVDDVPSWRAWLAAAGVPILDSVPIPGHERFECRDPVGNRLELIQRSDA